jgi:hypothetical protein
VVYRIAYPRTFPTGMNKPDFIICAPLHFIFMSNGVLALAKLARAIESAGRSAYVCAYQHQESREVMFKVDFDAWQPRNEVEVQFVETVRRAKKEFGFKMLTDWSQQRIDESYVVYPEAILNNPLNAKRVIRYFLSKDGVQSGRKVNVGPDDFILAHSRVIHPNPHHVSYFAEVNPLFHNEGTYPAEHRQLDITYIGKGGLYGVTQPIPGTIEITRTWPAKKEQLAMLLRNCRFFYTADACSAVNVEALACGAIPAFFHNGPWSNEEIDGFEPGVFPRLYEGIQAGDNFYAEFETARVGYLQRMREYLEDWDNNIAQMIEKADRHFGLKQTSRQANAAMALRA